MDQPWYGRAYRRNLIDMHIADWDEKFLSEFDPQAYVETVCSATVQAAMVYTHSHAGHCYYPTSVGHQHGSLHGRDIFQPILNGFHDRGVSVIAYFSLIYDDHVYRSHPDWRIIRVTGEGAAERSRYGVCCPNSPYREYAAAHVSELCSRYHFEGIFLDMTFWPAVCYCPHCQARFAAEVGGEIPRLVDWSNPRWVAFQRARERWLVEFAERITLAVRRAAPHCSVQHQASTYLHSWRKGVTDRLAAANDYLGGDFYGDALEGSVVRKLYHNLSPDRPIEFMTSLSLNLRHHTSRKSPALLKTKVAASYADGAAFLFIDAIDPVGTINPASYESMAAIFADLGRYEPFMGGDLCQDVAIYVSTESKHDPADNGKGPEEPGLSTHRPHIAAVLGAAQALRRAHIPFGVIARANLANLTRHRVVVLPDVLVLGLEEAAAFREYVAGGGCLYASRRTGLVTPDGVSQADFLLGEVLGVSHTGYTQEAFTYVAPHAGGQALMPGYSQSWPLGLDHPQVTVRAHADAEVIGRLVLPYTDPAEARRYASIHSNPPGVVTDRPALVLNRYGHGRAVYAAGSLESIEGGQASFVEIVRHLGSPFTFEAQAPGSVEVTAFHQPDQHRYLISLASFQKDQPNIPVHGAQVRLRLGSRKIQGLYLLPEEMAWQHEVGADGTEIDFSAPPLETLRMFALDYI